MTEYHALFRVTRPGGSITERAYAHFLAVAKGEREDRNMPASWPRAVRDRAAIAFQRKLAVATRYQVTLGTDGTTIGFIVSGHLNG